SSPVSCLTSPLGQLHITSKSVLTKLNSSIPGKTAFTWTSHCPGCQSVTFIDGGSEFLLLSAMAYDRYVSICKPLQYPTIMSKTTISIFLVLAWLLPACQIAVPAILSADMQLCHSTLKGIFCNNSFYNLNCVSSRARSIFGVFALLNLVLFPFLFILFTYTRILIISYQSNRNVRKKAAQTCLPHLLVLISFSCLCAYDIIIVRMESDFPKTARFIMTLQAVLYHPLFNPIIYGLKMKEITKHLKRLFCQAKVI
ncbi:olfactory receptor 6N2-like, partial [Acanthopagrus schlegelii]